MIAIVVVAALGSAGVAATVIGDAKPIEKKGSARVEFMRSSAPAQPARSLWTLWGSGPARNHAVGGGAKLQPPFRTSYVVHGRAMIEFPPVAAGGRFYFGTYAGRVIAAQVSDGKEAWVRELGYCIASSPAVGAGVVYVTTKGTAPCQRRPDMHSLLFALDAKSGRTLWTLDTGLVESSPLLDEHRLYFASYDTIDSSTVWAYDTQTRKPIWHFPVPAKVTSSPALVGRRLYVGSYSSTLYALDSRKGKLIFATTPPGNYDDQSGFYGTPSVAYGRVYIGGIDGRVYAFGARSGALRWATATGSYVYSSPAVWDELVFAGSFKNQRFYCFDAATGRIRWSFKAEGKILGSPTVVAGVVYFSTTSSRTYALDARTGAQLWQFADGQFSPIIVAGDRVLLTGKGRVYGLEHFEPKSATPGPTNPRPRMGRPA